MIYVWKIQLLTIEQEICNRSLESVYIFTHYACSLYMLVLEALYVTVEVHSKPLKLKVDTGAKCNVLPKHIIDSLNISSKIDCNNQVKLVSYSGNTIDTIGQIYLHCKYNDEIHELLFQVIDQSFEPLIGLQSSLDLNVVTINNVDSVLQSSSLKTYKSHDTHTVIQ